VNTLYYNDLEIGAVFRSGGRTVTETDMMMFCMQSGDWNPIHCNSAFAAKTRFGQRIVPGLFGLSLITGAMSQWGVFEESAIAMLNIRDWVFKAPLLVGVTIYVEMLIEDKRPTSRKDAGIVVRKFHLLSENDEVLQEGYCDMMIRMEPEKAVRH